jgi:hypothetical protein
MCHAVTIPVDDDDRTIVTSNCSTVVPISSPRPHPLTAAAHHLVGTPSHNALNAITIDSQQAIADTGATSIFIMDGVDVDNKRIATRAPSLLICPTGKRCNQHTFVISLFRGYRNLSLDILFRAWPSLPSSEFDLYARLVAK